MSTSSRRTLAHFEQVIVRILDAVLDNPGNHRHIQITGQHQRHGFSLAGTQTRAGYVTVGAETELFGADALYVDLGDPLDSERQFEVQPRLSRPHVSPEELNNPDFILFHGEDRRPDGRKNQKDNDQKRAARKFNVFQLLDEFIHVRRHTATHLLLLFF